MMQKTTLKCFIEDFAGTTRDLRSFEGKRSFSFALRVSPPTGTILYSHVTKRFSSYEKQRGTRRYDSNYVLSIKNVAAAFNVATTGKMESSVSDTTSCGHSYSELRFQYVSGAHQTCIQNIIVVIPY
jgi:hypothetical protein